MARSLPMSDGSASSLRSPRFLAGAVFLVIVVVAGIVVTVGGGGSTSPAAKGPGTGAGAGAGGSSSSAGAGPGGSGSTAASSGSGGCHPSATDQSIPAAQPADVTWSLVHTVALPSS